MKEKSEISYEEILEIVDFFYKKAVSDILIGYHFDHVRSHLDEHVRRISDFWQLQLTGEMDHKESLPFAMIPLHKARKLKMGELNRWILLFDQTLDDFDGVLSSYAGLKNSWKEKIADFKKIFVHRVL